MNRVVFEAWYEASRDQLGTSKDEAMRIFMAGLAAGVKLVDATVPQVLSYGAHYNIGVIPNPSGFLALSPNFKCQSELAHFAILNVGKAESEKRPK